MELKKGEILRLEGGKTASVNKDLGEGGQGIVYEVKIDNRPYALKWYTCTFQNKKAFKENLKNNIAQGTIGTQFLWPLFLTEEKNDGSFGYVMELRKPDFSDFSDILNNKIRFSSLITEIDAAIKIVQAFQILHRKGLTYQDLNDGNFFMNVKTGDILICDNDNVTPYGMKNPAGIGGKPGYMAPEIVCGTGNPGMNTDYHSLAVVLFKMFCRHDPFMGKEYVDSCCITEKREQELYGSKPVFIFDDSNHSNRPVRGIHKNPLLLWPMLSPDMQEAFKRSFGIALKEPDRRLCEMDWLKLLINFRDQVLICPAGDNKQLRLYLSEKNDKITFYCKHTYSYPYSLQTEKYTIPLFPGKKLYAFHTDIKSPEAYHLIAGEVVTNKKNPSIWGIKNLSEAQWFFSKDEITQQVVQGDVIPITLDMTIEFAGIKGKIIKHCYYKNKE